MNDELDTLRPEVREALDRLVYFLTGTHNHNDFYTIRAELLRLAEDAAMFAHAVSLGQRYKQRAETAEAELAALRAKTQWQPIETAPKDGTRILVAVKNGNWSVRTARMSSRMGIGWIVAWDGSYATARCVKPTHWMPLPEPPAERGEG